MIFLTKKEKKAINMLNIFRLEHKFFNIRQADNLETNIEIVLNLLEKLQEENKQLKNAVAVANKLEERIKEKFIPKGKIVDIIEKISLYKKLAKESIGQRIVIADSDSLEYGKMQAHSVDMSILQELLESEE